jgi:hypothetical protein
VLVCDWVVVDCDDAPDVLPAVVVVADDESSSSDDVLELLDTLAAAAVDVVVVALWPSRHANTPPSESIVATLSAVAALRARAARGLRRPMVARRADGGGAVGSSMTVTVRTGGERAARAG